MAQLGHMQVCTSLQTDKHASIPPLSFYRPDALPAAQPTASKHWRHSRYTIYTKTCSPSGATWARRVTLISTSVALSQTPAYTARPWYGTSVSSGVTVYGWVVSVLDSGAEGPWFKSQPRCCRVTVSGKLLTSICSPSSKMVAALLRVAGVTAGRAESNGSLPPGLWLTSPTGWLLRTGTSSGTLHSVIEYGLPLLLL